MARRPHKGKPQKGSPKPSTRSSGGSSRSTKRSSDAVRLRRAASGKAWELLHPRCALDREDDIEEVEQMIEQGEDEIAITELRWLLSGCSDFMRAHRLLGELAVTAGDLHLARGHFGHAFRVGEAALKRAGNPQPVPYELQANQDFFACGKGLVYCLKKLDKPDLAQEVVQLLVHCDPTDPLNVRGVLAGDDSSC